MSKSVIQFCHILIFVFILVYNINSSSSLIAPTYARIITNKFVELKFIEAPRVSSIINNLAAQRFDQEIRKFDEQPFKIASIFSKCCRNVFDIIKIVFTKIYKIIRSFRVGKPKDENNKNSLSLAQNGRIIREAFDAEELARARKYAQLKLIEVSYTLT